MFIFILKNRTQKKNFNHVLDIIKTKQKRILLKKQQNQNNTILTKTTRKVNTGHYSVGIFACCCIVEIVSEDLTKTISAVSKSTLLKNKL